jgi:hypothetical protein
MVKIFVGRDCGSTPRKRFLKDLNIAFAEGDISYISNRISDDISWHLVGDKHIQGKNDFVEALEVMRDNPASELTISKIIAHGREGAASGEIIKQDGRSYAYCDVYEFRGARGTSIKSIQSYIIEIGDSEP